MGIKEATIAGQRGDIHFDVNRNGALDYYMDGGIQAEFEFITGATGLTGTFRTVVVKEFNLAWRLSANAASGQAKINLTGVTRYLKQGTICTLGTGINKESGLVVDSISGTEVTFTTNLQHSHVAGDLGDELFRSMGGLATDPLIARDNNRILIHELLHHSDFGNLADIKDAADPNNIMNYGAGMPTPLRFKELEKRYTTGIESQWRAVPR